MKKTISVFIVIGIIMSIMAFPATAAESNVTVKERVSELEQKYGIGINYEISESGKPAITLNNLETLDKAFTTLTPTVVKQVSKYYQKRNGEKIVITYITEDDSYSYNGGVLMAAFERKTSKIYVFLPSVAGKAVISGENPIALVHEFGHAFHLMAMEIYGEAKMKTEWTTLNNGHKYNSYAYENPNTELFISPYSSTSYEEDFAEVFSHTFVRDRSGTGFKDKLTKGGQITGLGRKVAYIDKMLPVFLTNSEQAVANYKKIYSTAVAINYNGIRFSGEYLQYIGYPQPKNILKGILNRIERTSKDAVWLRKLGAWKVTDTNNEVLYIFPGGSWTTERKALANSPAA